MTLDLGRSPAPAPWWQPHPPAGTRMRQVDGFIVSVRGPAPGQEDSGPHVFLVHGMVDASDTWAPLLPALAGCRVWHLDLPWSGRDGADWPGVAPALAWFQAALDLCGVAPDGAAIFIGHSFGATVLLEWLATRPRAPATAGLAVLLAPFYCPPQRKPGWDQIDTFARAVPQRFEQGLRVRLGRHAPGPVVLGAMARKLAERVLPDALLELFRLYLASRRWPVDKLGTPLHLVIGDSEGELAAGSARALAAAVPGAVMHTVAACGHYPMHEQPAKLCAIVDALVRIHAPETGAIA